MVLAGRMGRRWSAGPTNEAEFLVGQGFRDVGLARGVARAVQVHRMLCGFASRNPEWANGDSRYFLYAFVGHLTEERTSAGKHVRCKSTVLSYLNEISKYNMRVDNIDEVARRLDIAALRNGLSVAKREENPAIRHHILDESIFLAPIVGKGNVLLRTGIYLLLATGARAEHLTRIRAIKVNTRAIMILWGDRKVRERMNSFLAYPFEWSCRPPEDILTCLSTWVERRSSVTKSPSGRYVVAQRINNMIRRIPAAKAAGLSSSFYRRRLSTLLAERIKDDEMTEMEFELLLDHRLGTSYTRYHLEGELSQLEIRGV